MLPLRVRVDLGAMAIKEYSTLPLDCLVLYPGHSLRESYSSTEMQSVYSTTQANRVNFFFIDILVIYLPNFKTEIDISDHLFHDVIYN